MSIRLKEIDLYKAYKNWYEETSAFCCFFRATNFVTLKHYPDFKIGDAPEYVSNCVEKVISHIDKVNTENTLILVDLPGEQAIETAFWLKRSKELHCILTFNNVLHPYGLVGSEKFISYLVQFGEFTKSTYSQGFVFILDNSRYGEYEEDDLRRNFNNQYELSEEDLPSYEMLNELSFTNLLYIYDNEMKEDIKPYFEYLQENGIPVLKVDLNNNQENEL